MRYRTMFAGLLIGACTLQVAIAPGASAEGPTIERGSFEERFFDEFILELCGIETFTTLTQTFTVKTFPDGSEQVHVVRLYVPDDPRIPIERGAATAFVAPDGTRTVIGMPLQLFDADGGIRLLDAGFVEFGDELIIHGRHEVLVFDPDVDLAPYYCPPDV
jgi:hypothetical protein